MSNVDFSKVVDELEKLALKSTKDLPMPLKKAYEFQISYTNAAIVAAISAYHKQLKNE